MTTPHQPDPTGSRLPQPRSSTLSRSAGEARLSWLIAAVIIAGAALIAIWLWDSGRSRAMVAPPPDVAAPPAAALAPDTEAATDAEAPPPVRIDEGSMPAESAEPPQEASPDEIERFQKALAASIKARREQARQGDLLTPELVGYLGRVTRRLVEGEHGDRLLATLRETNPGYDPEAGLTLPTLAVNAEYPDDAAMPTIPPRLLAVYPELPEGIEYRFVGCRMILLNRDARIILDYTEECLW